MMISKLSQHDIELGQMAATRIFRFDYLLATGVNLWDTTAT